MILNTVLLAVLASHSLATPITGNHVVHEKRSLFTTSKGNRVHGDAIIPIRIALKQSNIEQGYDLVMDVSDPDSKNYGKHWTLEEVHEHFAPSEEAVAVVKAWLVEAGIHPALIGESADRGWIGINIPTKQAESLLGAKYHEHHSEDGRVRLGCDEYALPAHISDLVDYIKPGISLSPPMNKRDIEVRDVSSRNITHGPWRRPPYNGPVIHAPGSASLPPDLQDCGSAITPACIRALYSIPRNTVNSPENVLGVYEEEDVYAQEDLNLYFAKYAPYVPQGTHPKLYSIDGGTAPVPVQKAGGESDIDFQVAISLIYPQSTSLYQVGPDNANYNPNIPASEDTFLVPFLDAIDGSFCTAADKKAGLQCGVAPVPRVLSASYSSEELGNTQAAAVRSCNEIMKLSLQGSTFVFASGDYGVAGHPGTKDNGCLDSSGTPIPHGKIFNPQFGPDCPYVLAVGATQLTGDETVKDPESVMDVPGLGVTNTGATFSSSGGFSNFFKAPSYQAAAVATYLSKYAPKYPYYVFNGHNVGANGGVYNRAGRGIPDVSANGVNYTNFQNGKPGVEFGTSLATPLWASVITLLNEARTKAGRSPVGFVHPVLYKNPQAFHDIVSGTNPGCGTQGFPAAPGWDPSSGLGTPNFPVLLEVFNKAGGGGYGNPPSSYPPRE